MIGSVKRFSIVSLLLCSALALSLPACKQQAPDLERQRAVETRNEQLRKEIADMQKRIREAGEATPDLKQIVETRRNEVNEALARKTVLRKQETKLKLHYIELESRLKAFRDTFRNIQSSIANQN